MAKKQLVMGVEDEVANVDVAAEVAAEAAADAEVAVDINAQIAADVAKRIKTRSFSKTSTVGKASLFDVAKHARGVDYTVGGLFEYRWVNDEEANVSTKRTKGFMFPEEVSGLLKNIRQQNQVLMLRTKEAAAHNRSQIAELATNLEGKDFEKSALVEQGNKLRQNAGKVFRGFEKIEAGV